MLKKAEIAVVAAMSRKNRGLGHENRLLWHIPDDLKRFKELTAHHPIVMGRKTFESIVAILGKPLPGRPNIVVTRNPEFDYTGVTVVGSLEEGLEKAYELDQEEIHIGGGAEIYAQALPFVDKLYVTYVNDEPEADTFFPAFEDQFEIAHEHPMCEHNGLSYQWVDYTRNT